MTNSDVTFAVSDVDPTQLSEAEIDEALFLYRPEFRFVSEARFQSGTTQAVFSAFEYPYAQVPIRHLTREQAVLFVTQAAYVAAFRSAASGALGSLTETALREACLAERAVLTRVELHFRKLLDNRPGIRLSLRIESVKRIASRIYMAMSYEFEQGECHGSCGAMIRA